MSYAGRWHNYFNPLSYDWSAVSLTALTPYSNPGGRSQEVFLEACLCHVCTRQVLTVLPVSHVNMLLTIWTAHWGQVRSGKQHNSQTINVHKPANKDNPSGLSEMRLLSDSKWSQLRGLMAKWCNRTTVVKHIDHPLTYPDWLSLNSRTQLFLSFLFYFPSGLFTASRFLKQSFEVDEGGRATCTQMPRLCG